MEKQLVTFDEAIALRELGFDEPCFGYRIKGQPRASIQLKVTNSKLKKKAEKFRRTYKGILQEEVACPTYEQAFLFLMRESNPDYISRTYYDDESGHIDYTTPDGSFELSFDNNRECFNLLIEICKTEKK